MFEAIKNGDKFFISTSYGEFKVEFLKTLPQSRWNASQKTWSCLATCSAAMSLVMSGMRCDDSIKLMSQEFIETLWRREEAFSATGYVDSSLTNMPPWKHQVAMFNFADAGRSALFDAAMGTAKTKVAIDLLNHRGYEKALIVCPSAVLSVWRREFPKHSAVPWNAVVCDHKSVKAKHKEASNAMLYGGRVAIIINYESVWRKPFDAFVRSIEWDAIIADESHKIGKSTSKVTGFFSSLWNNPKFKLCLSGTPARTPTDIFGQFLFLDPGIYGTSPPQFRDKYAIVNRYIPQKIDGWKNLKELGSRYATTAIKVDSSVLDLPDAMHEIVSVEMEPAVRDAYDELKREMIVHLKEGTIKASNALVHLLRLQQLTSGFFVDKETEVITRLGTAKIDHLEQILESCVKPDQSLEGIVSKSSRDEPVVVFTKFRPDLSAVRAVCEKLGLRYGEISGATKDGLTDQGTMADKIDVVGVQIQSGGVGIDLTRSRYCVFYSVGFDPIDYQQALKRVHRPGQERPVTYYHLVTRGSIDEVVYRSISKKIDLVNEILTGTTSEDNTRISSFSESLRTIQDVLDSLTAKQEM